MADLLRDDLAAAHPVWIDESKRDDEARIRHQQSDFLAATDHAGEVLGFHALRHTCGARLVLAGVSLNVVQRVTRSMSCKS